MKASPEKLRLARERAELTQDSLAAELTRRLNPSRPVHFSTISRIENGHVPLTNLAMIEAWAGICGVGDFRQLLEGDIEDEEAMLAPILRALSDPGVRGFLGDLADLMNDLRPSKKEGVKQ